MKVFLIRHGESEGNAKEIHQSDDISLSDMGKNQAHKLGKRLQNLGIEVLLASPIIRTQESAGIINEYLKVPLIYDPRLREIRRPSEIVGRPLNDPEVMKIKELIKESHHTQYHYSDEENFFDLRTRVQEFLQELNTRDESVVAIVTHGITMRMIMAEMFLGIDFTHELFHKIASFFFVTNTGVTICEHQDKVWHLLSWNDHGHLHC
ncbi:MAG: hypothetical protein A2V81_00505 [Candidatus Abawacabacteria bacterium RBG_16_42_10]|uniref:Phosphoglycerate mutase n=1 Tax=Candidatus Abawacabacteria bacterium RBG_16_42_10 TaxID=1817814 RepID=A0A1F4XKJ6_9BACT|nr:MAG: hypothetical protein A2V81_00505 [Candidatus Abawacabacteria bacterium RBG_16_42_10]